MANHQNQGKKDHLLPFIKGVINTDETVVVVVGVEDGLVIVVSYLLIP